MAEINMTPLIDVMLVLLIIFMIAAPLMTAGLEIDLPKTGGQRTQTLGHAITIAIDAEGRIKVGGNEADPASIADRIREAAHGDAEAEVMLEADRRAEYGRVVDLISRIQQAGLSRIAFVSRPESADR